MKKIFKKLIISLVIVIITYFISGDSGSFTIVIIGGLSGVVIGELIWNQLKRKKVQKSGRQMKLFEGLNYKEKALRLFFITCILSLTILIPDFPISIYVIGILALCSGIAYNSIKHLNISG
ncbi:hypothetical protein SAMN04487936_103394 [Halobacillus dabanensis]|uniref:Uncharacterized protein n=1 Tax=Halobacillus dabanensis TaxID=240302 RepID=A0A1I3TIJ4_HALDA|nr:hypothetical protein [Halobacillus dabanensis]SFJ70362.1 hypothetical protein SAMN04487936_103394 [Halobacillus dabanensis]